MVNFSPSAVARAFVTGFAFTGVAILRALRIKPIWRVYKRILLKPWDATSFYRDIVVPCISTLFLFAPAVLCILTLYYLVPAVFHISWMLCVHLISWTVPSLQDPLVQWLEWSPQFRIPSSSLTPPPQLPDPPTVQPISSYVISFLAAILHRVSDWLGSASAVSASFLAIRLLGIRYGELSFFWALHAVDPHVASLLGNISLPSVPVQVLACVVRYARTCTIFTTLWFIQEMVCVDDVGANESAAAASSAASTTCFLPLIFSMLRISLFALHVFRELFEPYIARVSQIPLLSSPSSSPSSSSTSSSSSATSSSSSILLTKPSRSPRPSHVPHVESISSFSTFFSAIIAAARASSYVFALRQRQRYPPTPASSTQSSSTSSTLISPSPPLPPRLVACTHYAFALGSGLAFSFPLLLLPFIGPLLFLGLAGAAGAALGHDAQTLTTLSTSNEASSVPPSAAVGPYGVLLLEHPDLLYPPPFVLDYERVRAGTMGGVLKYRDGDNLEDVAPTPSSLTSDATGPR